MTDQVPTGDLALRIYAMANLAEVSKQLALEATAKAADHGIDGPFIGVRLRAIELHWRSYDSAVEKLLMMILQGRVGGTVTQITMGRAI